MYGSTPMFNQLYIQRDRGPWPRRRRRLAILLTMPILAVFALAQAVHGSGPVGYETVRVGAGDTLWTIAQERYPGADAREKVDEIMRANNLHQAELYPGETLRVPAE
jgi:nucleoid-associated protein YgaU